jgi:hypothetical protein
MRCGFSKKAWLVGEPGLRRSGRMDLKNGPQRTYSRRLVNARFAPSFLVSSV